MKILALYASPHKPQSNSNYLLDVIIDEINHNGGHQVLKYDLTTMHIGACINCGVCRRPGSNGCFQKDDMETIATAITEADYIFMASPLYWWNISATLKGCIDRFYGIPFSFFHGKTIHLVMTGGSDTTNEGYRLVKNTMQCVCDYIGAHLETYFASASTATIPAWKNETLIGQAKAIGRKF
jgi:multimeric flavodoxin WrbA